MVCSLKIAYVAGVSFPIPGGEIEQAGEWRSTPVSSVKKKGKVGRGWARGGRAWRALPVPLFLLFCIRSRFCTFWVFFFWRRVICREASKGLQREFSWYLHSRYWAEEIWQEIMMCCFRIGSSDAGDTHKTGSWYLLRVVFKIFDEHSCPFYIWTDTPRGWKPHLYNQPADQPVLRRARVQPRKVLFIERWTAFVELYRPNQF